MSDPFPQQFFDTARRATSVFEKLGAEWMFIGVFERRNRSVAL